jgi:hypothetical protein
MTSAYAEDKPSKDWIWNVDGKEYYYAATETAERHVFGQYCYFEDETCIYLITNGMKCDVGTTLPALLNSDNYVSSVELYCGEEMDGVNVLVFKDFDEVDAVAKENKIMALALATQSGHFRVTRYSLVGSTYAIESMRQRAVERTNKKEHPTDYVGEQLL